MIHVPSYNAYQELIPAYAGTTVTRTLPVDKVCLDFYNPSSYLTSQILGTVTNDAIDGLTTSITSMLFTSYDMTPGTSLYGFSLFGLDPKLSWNGGTAISSNSYKGCVLLQFIDRFIADATPCYVCP
jgi:hypothetical protein